uniref:3-hydroxyisobutyrate dehydrogenase n=1 Tax=Steinernema glaseri TaxID=37863 RepID=A0A1I7ZIL9_9BILA
MLGARVRCSSVAFSTCDREGGCGVVQIDECSRCASVGSISFLESPFCIPLGDLCWVALRAFAVAKTPGVVGSHSSIGCATMTSLVGFIGLGNMGSHMARNLIKNGVKLVVYDVDAVRVAELKSDGADVAQHPADVAVASKTIVTMLPSSPHVRAVYGTTPVGSDTGLLAKMQPGTLCMDSSTIDQSASIEVAAAVAKKQSSYVDAPVSGGVVGAQNATLTFMVGGDDASFKAASKYLDMMGKNTVHCGKVGSGQAAKICNNMLLGIEMIGVAETMNLGMRMGLDPKLLASIINTSSGRCWSSDTYNPVPGVIEGIPPSKGYAGGFGSALMAKDLGLAQNASTDVRAPTPLGSLAHQIYRLLATNPQYKNLDFGVVYQFLKEQMESK